MYDARGFEPITVREHDTVSVSIGRVAGSIAAGARRSATCEMGAGTPSIHTAARRIRNSINAILLRTLRVA